ncbi:MAG TPA: helix-turn-helix domain-containing protein [Micromonospora sp.]
MLRIRFNTEGLAAVRLGRPAPLFDTVRSLRAIGARRPAPQRREARWPDGEVRQALAPRLGTLLPLVPAAGYCPDFLTPAAPTGDLDADIDAVLSTRPARLRAELEILASYRRLPAWTYDLARGDLPTLRRLGDALRGYHRLAVAPADWAGRDRIEADRAVRINALAGGGVSQLLTSFGPGWRWNPPVLEIDTWFDDELAVDSRGLVLAPSLFLERVSVTDDGENAPVLGYPVPRDVPPAVGEPAVPVGALDALLGRTRAAVLRAALAGGGTTEIARRVGVSPGSVSEHARVLREAGLLVTRRLGQTALHTATRRGRGLLGDDDPTLPRPR